MRILKLMRFLNIEIKLLICQLQEDREQLHQEEILFLIKPLFLKELWYVKDCGA